MEEELINVDISEQVTKKYVAFCDVLGFTSFVETDFNRTINLYIDFKRRLEQMPFSNQVSVSIYSDSILIVSDELHPVLRAVNILWMCALFQDWLIRGGIGYGRHWEDRSGGNCYIVSEALIRAVNIEKSIKHPVVALCQSINVPTGIWAQRLGGQLLAPLLHFGEISLVNPFNIGWFQSAKSRVEYMLQISPQHAVKYNWFLQLAEAVDIGDHLLPVDVVKEFIAEGFIQLVDVDSAST